MNHCCLVNTSLYNCCVKNTETFNIEQNNLTGEIPKEMCGYVENGTLANLWADCSGGDNAQVVCSCCHKCY